MKVVNLAIIAVLLLSLFQNCGKVSVSSPSSIMAANTKSGQGFICLPDGYTLDSFFITNLNAKASSAGLEPDTDGDGLSDNEEASYGFNPKERRSAGKVMDAICHDLDYGVSCSGFNLSCNLQQSVLGLNECDLLALNLNQTIQIGAGIDSDKDGIPDYLEIRINSFPNLNDAFNDLDFDQSNSIQEAEFGTSVRNSNNNILKINTMQISKTKLQSTAKCTGEYWKIDILNLPTVAVEKFTDTGTGQSFSHEMNENLVMTFLKIKPISNPTSNSKTFSGIQKVKYDYNNLMKSFTLDQSKLLFTGDVEP